MGIGQKLRYLREQNALTLTRLASMLDVERDLIRKLERDQIPLPEGLRDRLADIFDIKPEYFDDKTKRKKKNEIPISSMSDDERRLLDFSDFGYGGKKKSDGGSGTFFGAEPSKSPARKGGGPGGPVFDKPVPKEEEEEPSFSEDASTAAAEGKKKRQKEGLASSMDEIMNQVSAEKKAQERREETMKEKFSDVSPSAKEVSGVVGTSFVKSMPDLSGLLESRKIEIEIEPTEEVVYLVTLIEILIRKGIVSRDEFDNVLDLVRMRIEEGDF